MVEPVRVYIERIKAALGVTTDEEAARALGLSKQAIANWRRRGKVPLEVELRLVNAYGPSLAHSERTRDISLIRENEVTYASTLYFYSKFEKEIGRPFSLAERIALGYVFNHVENKIRSKVREIGFEYENSQSVLELVILLINGGMLKEIEDILSRSIIT